MLLLLQEVTNEVVTDQELGGAPAHAKKSGLSVCVCVCVCVCDLLLMSMVTLSMACLKQSERFLQDPKPIFVHNQAFCYEYYMMMHVLHMQITCDGSY